MARRASVARVKSNRSYTVEEAADVVGVTEQTIRLWIAQGLPALTSRRPALILGSELKDYLARKDKSRRQPLGPGEFLCFSCKTARRAAFGLIDYHAKSPTHGRLEALCEVCEGTLSLNIRAEKLPAWREFYGIGGTDDEAA